MNTETKKSDLANQTDVSVHRLKAVGLNVTWIYLLALIVACPLFNYLGWIQIAPLSLNEIGDLLAGLFGPLAIFWLVLGFLQQGDELRNSVETLKLQAKELQNSVEQQRAMVELTREQLAHEREVIASEERNRKVRMQPKFILDLSMVVGVGTNTGRYEIKVTNTGGAATKFSILAYEGNDIVVNHQERYVGRGWQSNGISVFHGAIRPKVKSKLRAQINYEDDDGEQWEVTYELSPPLSEDGFGRFGSFEVERDRVR